MINVVNELNNNTLVICHIDSELKQSLKDIGLTLGDWVNREDILKIKNLPPEFKEWVEQNKYQQYLFENWELIKIHFEINQIDEDEEDGEIGQPFKSIGTFTTNYKYNPDKYGAGGDVDRIYLAGEMGMQHESAVMYDVIEWASKHKVDPNLRYIFEVKGYKGKLKFIGTKEYRETAIPINHTTLASLIRAYIYEQDEESLRKMFEYLTIKGYRHGVIKPKIEGDELVFPKKNFYDFLDEFDSRKR